MELRYTLYLNGSFYGCGTIEYINELISDYLVNCNMYGRNEVDFRVEKVE